MHASQPHALTFAHTLICGNFFFGIKRYKTDQIEYTVIPRLTKIIRSGITFVSRNLR